MVFEGEVRGEALLPPEPLGTPLSLPLGAPLSLPLGALLALLEPLSELARLALALPEAPGEREARSVPEPLVLARALPEACSTSLGVTVGVACADTEPVPLAPPPGESLGRALGVSVREARGEREVEAVAAAERLTEREGEREGVSVRLPVPLGVVEALPVGAPGVGVAGALGGALALVLAEPPPPSPGEPLGCSLGLTECVLERLVLERGEALGEAPCEGVALGLGEGERLAPPGWEGEGGALRDTVGLPLPSGEAVSVREALPVAESRGVAEREGARESEMVGKRKLAPAEYWRCFFIIAGEGQSANGGRENARTVRVQFRGRAENNGGDKSVVVVLERCCARCRRRAEGCTLAPGVAWHRRPKGSARGWVRRGRKSQWKAWASQ
jgi:hypothetical protein